MLFSLFCITQIMNEWLNEVDNAMIEERKSNDNKIWFCLLFPCKPIYVRETQLLKDTCIDCTENITQYGLLW